MDTGRDTHYRHMAHTPVVLGARRHSLDKKELEDNSVQVDIPDSARDSPEPAGKPDFAEGEILGRKVEHTQELADTPELAEGEQTLDKKVVSAKCRGAMNRAHSPVEEG